MSSFLSIGYLPRSHSSDLQKLLPKLIYLGIIMMPNSKISILMLEKLGDDIEVVQYTSSISLSYNILIIYLFVFFLTFLCCRGLEFQFKS